MTHFDTAEAYGPFANEELVGEALPPIRDTIGVPLPRLKLSRDSACRPPAFYLISMTASPLTGRSRVKLLFFNLARSGGPISDALRISCI